MRTALDDEDFDAAMRHARELQSSANSSVRSAVLDTYQWIGRRALPEICEMMRDCDSEVAAQALTVWGNIIEDVSSPSTRCAAVVNAIACQREEAGCDEILQHISGLDEKLSLRTLEKIILHSPSGCAVKSANSWFEHISGESWSSTNRTQLLIEERSK